MDKFAKWAIAGSLLWLALATSLILGTKGPAILEARVSEPLIELDGGSWQVLPAAAWDADLSGHDFRRC